MRKRITKIVILLTVIALTVTGCGNGSAYIDSLKQGLYGTFILEGRWQIIVDGLLTTLLITFVSMVIGTILGIVLMVLSDKYEFIGKFIDKAEKVYNGIPMVVVLMVFYYVVLAESGIEGTAVSIIAFSISFGLSVSNILKTSILSVGKDQREASASLGFSDLQTLCYIVLPQAMIQFIPRFKSALITMLKGTSVVGYIAVEDITKASDIIRSRTYETFFPIATTAIVYLLLVVLITRILEYISGKFDVKSRSRGSIIKRFEK